ncbi:MAG: RpiB/LacA/LacB family sugar-phosphate isomerase [Candidatus Marsarchaeota archaeon]|nr:RpiB/LacA/LacB family sugar-phosphate isomerase [Candidatus Marsarchaeota archaeon]MCL5413447.1 RpiB/LacA/LacB family sugar-phosphate isomerase [Candidatus Marsarchaeota archaeon]
MFINITHVSGVGIKILIISNIEGAIDSVVNSLDLEGITVMTKEVAGDSKTLAKQACDLLSSGRFGFIIALPTNPIVANLTFNKYEGITSAVCHDLSDVKSAREENSNVMIVKSPGGDMGRMISAFVKGGGFGSMKIKLPTITLDEMKPQVQQLQQKVQQQIQQAETPEQKKSPLQLKKFSHSIMEAPVEDQVPKRPGISGWIKDSLGIIDTEKQDKPAEGSALEKDKKKEKKR